MVVGEAMINNIMGGIENTGSVRCHNHKKKLKQRFDIIKKLGQGTYGKVQLGINKETGQEVAIKTIKKSKIETEADLIRIRREIQIMSSVHHPNIIHIYEVFENREKMVIVMEYAAGGELYDYLFVRKMLAEDEARRIFRQIATACYYCHKHKICHRDLKLENILLDENGHAKIADFGLSNVFDDHRHLSTYCGSPLYASPEIVKGTPYHGPEVDCWSLGVLLYTLVYGAMPFDGSNFKRLVKSISQGEYFEPQNPSPASGLIQEMLTVNPKNRANIEKICAHWWVNESYDESCLDISEELANQTPVRLDVLLSLNPPPGQLEADSLVLTGESAEESKAEPAAPTRSQSAGSLMDRSIKDLMAQDKVTPKRKLETTVSTDQANVTQDGKRKEKIVKESTVADISVPNNAQTEIVPPLLQDDIKMAEDVIEDPQMQGAACAEIIEEAKVNEAAKKVAAKIKKTTSVSLNAKVLEEINENPSQENIANNDKENKMVASKVIAEPIEVKEKETKEDAKTPVSTTPKKKIVKKKVLTDKNETVKVKEPKAEVEKKVEVPKPEVTSEKDEEPKEVPMVAEAATNGSATSPLSKPTERRQSRIFEQAEKFQSMIFGQDKAPSPEKQKPKKIIIPGVSVGGFKKEFERKASLTSTSPPKLKNTTSKKLIIDDRKGSIELEQNPLESPKVFAPPTQTSPPTPITPAPVTATSTTKPVVAKQPEGAKPSAAIVTPTADPTPPVESSRKQPPEDEERKLKMQNAVSIISNALDGTRKSKSRPCMVRKPPVPFGASGRSASGSIGMISPLSPPTPKPFTRAIPSLDKTPSPLSSTPEVAKTPESPSQQHQTENQTSSAEITLKSATLPRRKSTKAQILLDYPKPKPAAMEFKTEMSHHVQAPATAPPTLSTQRSEVSFPITSPPPSSIGFRSMSVDPEMKKKEHIIPIAFERRAADEQPIMSPPTKPPVPRMYQSQRSASSQRSNSLSRQSTQESDTETSATGEPIKKSPREYIIPIAVEGGGYVTPRAGSLEPSDTASTVTNSSRLSGSKFRTPRRMMSMFDRDGSEDESPFTSLHRHSSFGKDSDTEGEPKKDAFHMHRLRSSRPRKSNVEHADSLSSGDDDDDDGFEFLTAENLFSTLLSRVRNLTHRLNDDPSRPAFPNSRFLSQFDHGNFFNRMEPLGSSRNSPLGRQFSRERSVNSSIPWRRSVSRDLSTDIDSVFKDNNRPTHTATLPRGEHKDDLNLSDLNLKKLKLTEEDALALSYLTPGLSRRIQKQLFASLPPSEAKKISRTLSMRNDGEKPSSSSAHHDDLKPQRHSVDRMSSTLPRKFSYDKRCSSQQNLTSSCDINQNTKINNNNNTSTTNTSTYTRDVTSPYTDRSSSYESSKSEVRPRYYRASSLREPSDYKTKFHSYSLRSPESSISEISTLNDDDLHPPGPETIPLSKYMHTKPIEPAKLDQKPTRRISRFLRPDFFDPPKEDNVVTKEKKERERETQQVLKEIRDKRIKNRLHLRRERSLSKEKELISAKLNDNDKVIEVNECGLEEEEGEKLIKCKDLVEALKKVDKEKESSDKYKTDKNVVAPSTSKLKDVKMKCKENAKDEEERSNMKEREKLLKNVSDNIKNIESNVLSRQNEAVNKKERVSKLVRPKSYPTENGNGNGKQDGSKEKEKSPENAEVKTTTKVGISKLKKPGTAKLNKNSEKEKEKSTLKSEKSTEQKQSTKSKFLQSIEKKFEKLRSLSVDDKLKDKDATKKEEEKKDDKKSGVESAIKRLREQSVPRNTDQMTESTLIKRAVSVEDFSNVKAKALQPSRKSVSKILNLFKKYEDKDKTKEETPAKSGAEPTVMLTDINESNIPMCKTKSSDNQRDVTSPDKGGERPKSLFLDKVKRYNGSRSDTTLTSTTPTTTITPNPTANNIDKKCSKLPVNSYKKSLNFENRNGDDVSNNNVNGTHDRRNLKLDLKDLNTPAMAEGQDASEDYNLNRISYTTDESSALLSPCDETLSCDSWSVCSDYHHTQDLLSPLSPNGNTYSGDENESVIDRIRRKSFYTRFNEKKKPRKSLVGNYKDLDLYKDYSQRSLKYKAAPTPVGVDYSNSYRRSSGYSSSGEGEDYRPYTRSKSVTNDYVNVPNRYQTYNPRKTNIASLYSPDERNYDDTLSTGTYKKYNCNQNNSTSRLSSLSRSSRSPSTDFQYIPHAPNNHQHASMTPEHDSMSPTPSAIDHSNNVTEHAV